MKFFLLFILLFFSCSSADQRESVANDSGEIVFRTHPEGTYMGPHIEYFITKEGLVITIGSSFFQAPKLIRLDSLPPIRCKEDEEKGLK